MGSSADQSAKNMWHLGLISDIKYQVIQHDIRDMQVKSQSSLAQSFAIKHNGNMNRLRDMYIINSST